MAGVAQLVRASDCGPEGRWFDSSHPPTLCGYSTVVSIQVFQTWDESSILSTRTKKTTLIRVDFCWVIGLLVYWPIGRKRGRGLRRLGRRG